MVWKEVTCIVPTVAACVGESLADWWTVSSPRRRPMMP
jgi:hypothetical protein